MPELTTHQARRSMPIIPVPIIAALLNLLKANHHKPPRHSCNLSRPGGDALVIELSWPLLGQKGSMPVPCLVSRDYTFLHSHLNLHFILSMRIAIAAGVLVVSVAAHPRGGSLLGLPLDISALLKSLGPAPANDPRFTNFHPAGSGDGA